MALCGLVCKEGLLRVSMILLLKLRFKYLYNFFNDFTGSVIRCS